MQIHVKHIIIFILLLLNLPVTANSAFNPSVNPQDSLVNKLEDLYYSQPEKTIRIVRQRLMDNTAITLKNKTRMLHCAGAAYYFLGKPDSSLYYLNTSLELRKQMRDPGYLGDGFNALSIIYLHLGNYDTALQMNRKAYQNYKKTADTLSMVNSLKGMANVYTRKYQNDSSIFFNLRALKLLQNRTDSLALKQRAGLLMNIGNLMERTNDTAGLDRYFKKAEKVFREINHQQELARLYHNLSVSYLERRQLDSAQTYIEKALRLKRKHHMDRNLASSYAIAGDIYKQKKQYQQALRHYQLAVSTAKKVNEQHFYFESLLALAKLQFEKFSPVRSKETLAKLSGKLESLSPLQKAQYHHLKSAYYSKISDFKTALKHFEKYQAWNDTAMNTKMKSITLELEKKYRIAEKEKENQILKNRLIRKEHREERQKIYLITMSIAVALLIVFLSLVIILLKTRSKSLLHLRQLRKAEKEKNELEIREYEQRVKAEKHLRELQDEKYQKNLEVKKRELFSSAMLLTGKNQVIKEIQKILKNTDDNLRNTIMQLVNSSKNLDKDWEQLKTHFEQVHPDFFTTLKNKYPSLTNYDLRMAAYLKINLSTKEIAQMLNITPGAVSKSRQRLRKKLKTKSHQELTDFFRQI